MCVSALKIPIVNMTICPVIGPQRVTLYLGLYYTLVYITLSMDFQIWICAKQTKGYTE